MSNEIQFDAASHTYTRNGSKYTSISKVISTFKTAFPKQRVAIACANKRGVSPEVVIQEWDDKRDKACEFGTYVHERLEEAAEGKPFQTSIQVSRFDKGDWEYMAGARVKSFKEWFKDRKGVAEVERVLYIDKYHVAGTGDLILRRGKIIDLFDHKTNEKLTFDGKGRFLPPFRHMIDSKYNGYALQLSLYMFMLEGLGYKAGELGILWYNPEGKLVHLPVPYMKEEAEMALTDFRIMNPIS